MTPQNRAVLAGVMQRAIDEARAVIDVYGVDCEICGDCDRIEGGCPWCAARAWVHAQSLLRAAVSHTFEAFEADE